MRMAGNAPGFAGLGAQFVRRVLFIALFTGLALLALRLAHVLLLLFGAMVIAVVLRSLADLLKPARLGRRLSVAIAALLVAGAVAAAGWLFGAQISLQVSILGERLPEAWAFFKSYLLRLPGGAELVRSIEGARADGAVVSNILSGGGVLERFTGVVQSTAGAVLDLVLVIVAGVYLAAAPQRYQQGAVLLLPPNARGRATAAVDACGQALKKWLLGAAVSMATVGTLVGLGAWAIGLPSPLALGILAGLAEFVPLVGPVAASIPGILLGLTLGPEKALWALALYFGVQQLESNVITPMVQRRAAELPPIVTLFSVVSFAVLFGPLGLILATPLAVITMVLIKTLYMRDVLGEAVRLPGQPKVEDED